MVNELKSQQCTANHFRGGKYENRRQFTNNQNVRIENVKTSYRNGFEMYFTHLHTIVHNILGKFTHIVSERGKEKKSL